MISIFTVAKRLAYANLLVLASALEDPAELVEDDAEPEAPKPRKVGF